MVRFGFVFPAAAPWTKTCSAPLVNLYIQVKTDLSAASDWIGLSETGGKKKKKNDQFFYAGFMSEWMVGPERSHDNEIRTDSVQFSYFFDNTTARMHLMLF